MLKVQDFYINPYNVDVVSGIDQEDEEKFVFVIQTIGGHVWTVKSNDKAEIGLLHDMVIKAVSNAINPVEILPLEED